MRSRCVERTDPEAGHLTTNRQRRWTAYLSNRLWVLCALLVVLGALALMQYRWIDQLAKAQRQRTRANLSSALSNVESDFDIEITRAFLAFQVPFPNVSYVERYEEWLHDAPYPQLVRGVYLAAADVSGTLPKPIVAQEPAIRHVEWPEDFQTMAPQFDGIGASVAAPIGFQVFSTSGGAGPFVSAGPQITVDGNPAFAFPTPFPAARFTSRVIVRALGKERSFQEAQFVRSGGRIAPPQWVLVVFNANYIRSTFLPALVERYFRGSSASDFDVIAVHRNPASSSTVVFPAPSDSVPTGFANPGGRVQLFQLRSDCFSTSYTATPIVIAANAAGSVRMVPTDRLSDILARKPTACSNPAPPTARRMSDTWELLGKYHAGSLDEAITTFRRRNLLLSGTVLLILAMGVSMAVLLAERGRALAETQADFILGVSHELRTPLTVIRVAADNLRKGIVENSEKARSYGEIIHTKATDLSNMIEETLALARMRSGVIRQGSPVRAEQIIKDALADSDFALRDAGMKLDLDVALDLPGVEVDLHLIKRCVGNLIQNAIKYAATGEKLVVRARTAVQRDKKMVEIAVEDHGPGISEDDLPHIFEPFYRGKTAVTSQIAGIGLGLTLVKRAVEAHGGAVEVESAATTRFSIFLPVRDVHTNGHKVV